MRKLNVKPTFEQLESRDCPARYPLIQSTLILLDFSESGFNTDQRQAVWQGTVDLLLPYAPPGKLKVIESNDFIKNHELKRKGFKDPRLQVFSVKFMSDGQDWMKAFGTAEQAEPGRVVEGGTAYVFVGTFREKVVEAAVAPSIPPLVAHELGHLIGGLGHAPTERYYVMGHYPVNCGALAYPNRNVLSDIGGWQNPYQEMREALWFGR